ncbi:MAG: radical SAM protein [Deltaproteobacteria bacterium]
MNDPLRSEKAGPYADNGEPIGADTTILQSRPVQSGSRDGEALLEEAWRISRANHGNLLTVHVPGMFVVNGRRGKYRAVSITAARCDLNCEHCKGTLLTTMSHAASPQALVRIGYEAAARGDRGMLVTGGCDEQGRLPWKHFLAAIQELKAETDLTITVHTGQTDFEIARALKDAGVDQALVDIIGDEVTAREVYHLSAGTSAIRQTLESLARVELETVPHVIFGIYYGREKGEHVALKMLKDYPVKKYAVVVLMPTRGTPMADVRPPSPERVASFIARARIELPHLRASLGCARPRGRYRKRLDALAVKAGINALAIPSDEALGEAERRGLDVVYKETCCSLG